MPITQDHGFGRRSQALLSAYVVNGSLYLLAPADLRARRSLVVTKTTPLLIESSQEALDIEPEWNCQLAQLVVGNSREMGL